MGLRDLEPHGNAKGSDGFFHKALLQAKESEQHAPGVAREVKVVANGHCHGTLALWTRFFTLRNVLIRHAPVTENCRRVKGVWNCFGGGG